MHRYVLVTGLMAISSLLSAGDLAIDQVAENSRIATDIIDVSQSFDIAIEQSGDYNQLAISVDSHIAATIDQIGIHGLIELATAGVNQHLSLSQEGSDNQIRATLSGNDLLVQLLQGGDGNEIEYTANGDDNSAFLSQALSLIHI